MNDLLKKFIITDGFLGRYEQLVKDAVIPYQEKVLKDEIAEVAKSHAIENFRIAAQIIETGKADDEFYGMVFQDSDVAKWLEAAAYSLANHPDQELEKRCDEVIDLIGRAQHEDGYLNTYFTVKGMEKRWTNLQEAHELYCAGHMMEAGVAYAEGTGKRKLLSIMSRMADHIYQHFMEESAEGYPGHPEIELALMRLYRCTGNEKYKVLAEHFVNVRGVDSEYFNKESKSRGWFVWSGDTPWKEYYQCDSPIREQTKAVGHAVRAVYLYTGMADVALETKDLSLERACESLWENITQRRMYVTGAIGSACDGEAFTKDYHLPNDTAYAETCAAIGLIFFSRKMLDLQKHSKYADTMERALYNCVLAGMQLDGEKFFYVNPLELVPGISGEAVTHRHVTVTRPNWFACACCPPNVARLLTSLGRYAWSEEDTIVYSHLFVGGTLDITDTFKGKIVVETEYPYGNQVRYSFVPDQKEMKLTLAIRLPEWSKNTRITLNGEVCDCSILDGYAYINKTFTAEDEVIVLFDMNVKRIFASTNVHTNNGKVAFTRGPLVYCIEGVDHKQDILSLRVRKDAPVEESKSEKLNGIVELYTEGYRTIAGEALYSMERPQEEACRITLIPYYTWSNRGINQMRVWIPEA